MHTEIKQSAIVLVSLTVLLTALFLVPTLKHTHDQTMKCQEEHHNAPYLVETFWGETSDKCTITKVEKFNGNCKKIDYIYSSKCQSILLWKKEGELQKIDNH